MEAHTRHASKKFMYQEIRADMSTGKKKRHSSLDSTPIPGNCKPRADLPLPLRELADLLAELAVNQMNELSMEPKKGEKKQ